METQIHQLGLERRSRQRERGDLVTAEADPTFLEFGNPQAILIHE
jgi:hypothetical protein